LGDHGDASPIRPDLSVLLAAIEASGEAILITSADLEEPGPRIEYANAAFARMTGYDVREAIGRSPRFLQGPETEAAVLDSMRAALTAGEAFQGEAVNYRKDGSTYVVEWLITPVRDPDGSITRWVSAQRDVTERHAAEERQFLLVQELHHRVRNTLATVKAVLTASARSSLDMAEFQSTFSDRITSLARTHTLLTEGHTQAVLFEALLRAELQPYDDDEPGRSRVVLTGPEVLLPSELAVPIGMAAHELTTNAVRHGSLRDPHGRLEVTWSVETTASGRVLHWTWDEHGGSPVALPTREGFGTQLLNSVLTYQIAAKVEIAFDPDGLRVSIDIPLPGQE
jgi:PAS domain S-box-containing protein